jgi:hypothetical protein
VVADCVDSGDDKNERRWAGSRNAMRPTACGGWPWVPMPDKPLNPYESPLSAPGHHPVPLDEPSVRHRWLASTGLILAVLIEVFPLEVDLLVMALIRKDVPYFLMAKGICLAVVLAPLFLYVLMNGWRGVMAAKGRITAIGVIVVLRLVLDIIGLIHFLQA